MPPDTIQGAPEPDIAATTEPARETAETHPEIATALLEAVSANAPGLEEEARCIAEEMGPDIGDIVGAIHSLLVKNDVDPRIIYEALQVESEEPIPPKPERTLTIEEQVAESGEAFQRRRFATACADLLPATDCESFLTCGFSMVIMGEPLEHRMYRSITWLIAHEYVLPTMDQSALQNAKKRDHPRIKAELERQTLETARKLLSDRGIENPGVEF